MSHEERERLLREAAEGNEEALSRLVRRAERKGDVEVALTILDALSPLELDGPILVRLGRALEAHRDHVALSDDLLCCTERIGAGGRFTVGEPVTTFLRWGRDLSSPGVPRVLVVCTDAEIPSKRDIERPFIEAFSQPHLRGFVEPLFITTEPRCIVVFPVPEGRACARFAPLPPEQAATFVVEIAEEMLRWRAHGVPLTDTGFHPECIFATQPDPSAAPQLSGFLTGWRLAYTHLRELLGEFAPGLPWLHKHLFLSHEEIIGRSPGPESDVYLLGQLLHFLIHGQVPFLAYDRLWDRIRAHMGGNWPELEAPQHLRQLVHDALRSQPDARPSLEAFIERAGGHRTPVRPDPEPPEPQERVRNWWRRLWSEDNS